ncbi:hypothetical protein DXG01_017213 [Tephrocybe rancida]|nr:hypothetical protein DXG01_017213 [Tephrocybe rancida]
MITLFISERLMQEVDRHLDAAFTRILEFNPPRRPVNFYAYPKLAPTLTFYDRHVDERLSLRKLTLLPSLTSDLSQAAHDAFENVKNNDNTQLPSVDDEFPTLEPKEIMNHGQRADARKVARQYQTETSSAVSIMASMLLLHPNSPTWTASFRLMEYRPPRPRDYTALNEDYALQFFPLYTEGEEPSHIGMIEKGAWNAMEESTREEISQASERFRFLAVWQMFYIRREARRALKQMDILASLDKIPLPSFQTLAPLRVPANVELAPSPDAINTAWGVSVASFVDTSSVPATEATSTLHIGTRSRRSTRIAIKASKRSKETNTPPRSIKTRIEKEIAGVSSIFQHIAQWGNVTVPSPVKPTCSDEQMATSILQHAWSRAVERDSTFIVLHCGTYERIAFRHRSSGTLFISGLIEVEKCSDPAYGAIHLGLFISIVKDVLDRTRQLIDAEASDNSRKRKRQRAQIRESHKRPKTRAVFAQEQAQQLSDKKNFEVICTEIAHRPLALLRIQHSHYNSPVPASFLRYQRSQKQDQLNYKPEEYFCITLTSSLGVGGTGDAHEGVIDLLGPGGDTLSLPNVVVKFAFHSDERHRLRHESKVYEHLKASNVTCVPHHFGLFKDTESDTLALIMTKGGTSLPKRIPQPEYDPSFTVTKSERDDFIKALESIHAAGVRHRDIRGDNLVVNNDGVVNIIDFDRASMKSRQKTMQREMEHLVATLDGDYSGAGLENISLRSFQESGRRSPEAENREAWEQTDEDSDRSMRPVEDVNISIFDDLWSSEGSGSGEDIASNDNSGPGGDEDGEGEYDTDKSGSTARGSQKPHDNSRIPLENSPIPRSL